MSNKKSIIKKWFANARDVSVAQSLLPSVLAVVLAISTPSFCPWAALLAVAGVVAAHMGMNLADDYFDYRVDMLSDREKVTRKGFRAMLVKYPYLTDGSETPATLLRAIALFFLTALACGLPVFILRTRQFGFLTPTGSWILPAVVLLTALLGIFYSAPPLKLGYRGWGEWVIGIIFGPLLMTGTYYAAAGTLTPLILWISIPVGLLVINILYTHSFVERESDAASNKMTFARLLRTDNACLAASYVFNFLPFVLILTAVALGYIHPLYLLVLLMIPRAVWLVRSLHAYNRGETGVPATPPLWLGRMMKDWNAVKEKKIDWFLMRWLTARNILSGFCLLIVLVKVTLILI